MRYLDDAGPDRRWDELKTMRPGDHMHLDSLMDRPPVPGSHEWLPVIDEVAAYLAGCEGRWVVSFSVGHCDSAPTTETSRADALVLVSRPEMSERPAVHRLVDPPPPPTWEGEHRRWNSKITERIVGYVSFSQSPDEREDGEGWTLRLGLEVNG